MSNVINFPSKIEGATDESVRWAYFKAVFAIGALFGGAYLVGAGAMLMVAGTVFLISAVATFLRREIRDEFDARRSR